MGGLTINIFCPCILWLPGRIAESKSDLGDSYIQPSHFTEEGTEAQPSKATYPVLTNSWPEAMS